MHLLYHHDYDGTRIEGNINDLVKSVREGKPIAIYQGYPVEFHEPGRPEYEELFVPHSFRIGHLAKIGFVVAAFYTHEFTIESKPVAVGGSMGFVFKNPAEKIVHIFNTTGVMSTIHFDPGKKVWSPENQSTNCSFKWFGSD